MNVTIVNNTDTTISINGVDIGSNDYFEGQIEDNKAILSAPRSEISPLLKEEDILSLGWKITPDVTDYAPLWISYIIGDGDGNYYELSNEDNDNIWCIQECDEKGNYVYDGEHMFFTLYDEGDLEDLMRLMGLRYG